MVGMVRKGERRGTAGINDLTTGDQYEAYSERHISLKCRAWKVEALENS